jgi:hypothetical protein
MKKEALLAIFGRQCRSWIDSLLGLLGLLGLFL